MNTFTSFEEFDSKGAHIARARPIVTVGSFDGLHLGHIYLIDELVEFAHRENAPSAVVTFSMHPREYMTGKAMPALTTPPHKRKLLLEHGVDAVLLLEFNEQLRQLSADDFVSECIVGAMTRAPCWSASTTASARMAKAPLKCSRRLAKNTT